MAVPVNLIFNQIFIKGEQQNDIQRLRDSDIKVPPNIRNFEANQKFFIFKFYGVTLKISRKGNLDIFIKRIAIYPNFTWSEFFKDLKERLLVILHPIGRFEAFHFDFKLCNIQLSGQIGLENSNLFEALFEAAKTSQLFIVVLGVLDCGIHTPITTTLANIKDSQVLYLKKEPSTTIKFNVSGRFSGVLGDYDTFEEFSRILQSLKIQHGQQ